METNNESPMLTRQLSNGWKIYFAKVFMLFKGTWKKECSNNYTAELAQWHTQNCLWSRFVRFLLLGFFQITYGLICIIIAHQRVLLEAKVTITHWTQIKVWLNYEHLFWDLLLTKFKPGIALATLGFYFFQLFAPPTSWCLRHSNQSSWFQTNIY